MYVFGMSQQPSFGNLDFDWDAVIPKDSVYRLIREFAPILINPEDLKGAYCSYTGANSLPALQMTIALLIQQMNDLSDRDMEVQTQVNLEFKYALSMNMADAGIEYSNFSHHRDRLIKLGVDKLILDRFTRLMYYLGVLKGDEPWLIDTSHVFAPVSAPSSIELIRQGMRMILRYVVNAYLKVWETLKESISAARYLGKLEEKKEFLLEESDQLSRLQTVVLEAEELFAIFEGDKWRKDTALMDLIAVLARILHERTEKTADGKVKLRDDRVKDILVSTIDLEARFGCKRKTKWRGYKVATVEVGNSGFIAAADVIKGNQYDGDSMIKIADQLPVDVVKDSNGAAKEPVLVGDSHFGAIDDRVTMKETANVTVVAPPHVKSNAMKIHEAGFSINEDHTILTCRSGASYTKATGTLTGKDFPLNRRDCGDCPYISECFGGGRRRKISIHEHHEKLVEIEEYAKTEEYKELMQLRGRIEPKQDELMNDYGMRRASYLGQRKTAFQARMKSLAINLNRLNRLMQNRKNPLKIELPKSIPPDIFKKAG